jgi:hypothetical protein
MRWPAGTPGSVATSEMDVSPATHKRPVASNAIADVECGKLSTTSCSPETGSYLPKWRRPARQPVNEIRILKYQMSCF